MRELTLGQAIALGALHGPAELLPVSSSGHTTAIPWLLGSDYLEVDPELRKALEVALHAGAVVALFIGTRGELFRLGHRQLIVIALGTAPAALVGCLFEETIELRLGTPSTIAGGLLVGGLVLALADRSPQRRRADEAGIVDGLWLGLAQACALVPGISRNGATLAAARLRRFTRSDAGLLSRRLAFPVIGGAALLKAWRLHQRHADGERESLAAGAAASLVSTTLTSRLIRRGVEDAPLLPYAVYRTLLAAAILIRARRDSTARRPRPARL
jgi:undecaprenyl-diphosphatase